MKKAEARIQRNGQHHEVFLWGTEENPNFPGNWMDVRYFLSPVLGLDELLIPSLIPQLVEISRKCHSNRSYDPTTEIKKVFRAVDAQVLTAYFK